MPEFDKLQAASFTLDEAKCYIERYHDSQLEGNKDQNQVSKATEHFKRVGRNEGRITSCAYRITQQQAQCYLNRYQDLQRAFGQRKNSWKKAMKHWIEFGFKEKRDPNCNSDLVSKCADEGQEC